MSLSLRQKQSFYHSLALLIRTGVTFPAALEKLSRTNRGSARGLIDCLRASLRDGRSVGESFARQPSAVSPLESSVLTAVERSGRLDDGLRELSEYFGALAEARSRVIKRLAYPICLLHFGIVVLAVPTLVLKGAPPFFRSVGTTFVFLYAAVAIVAMLAPMLRDFGSTSAAIDRLLNSIPLLGKMRRAFALSRFCTVYGLQLDAGVNVMDSLAAAGRASRSGAIRSAVDATVPEVRAGAQAGPMLAVTSAFPAEVVQAILVGEETGKLDEELRRVATEQRTDALATLDALADWLPKLCYVGIVLFLFWKIVSLIQTDIAPAYRNVLE